MIWHYCSLSYATFAVEVEGDIVTGAAPIAQWMIGKRWPSCRYWVLNKSGKVVENI